MNKIIKYLSYVCIVVFFFNDFLIAQENNYENGEVTETVTENKTADVPFSKYNIGERILGGFTYPGGTLAGYEEPERKFSYNYGIGATFEYRFNASHSLTSDISISKRDYYIQKSIAGETADVHYRFNFTDLSFGYRFSHNRIFIGSGFFAGYPLYGLSYVETGSLDVGEIDKSDFGTDAGIFVESGLRFVLNSQFNLLTGLRYDYGFSVYYSDEDELVTNCGYLFFELVYKI